MLQVLREKEGWGATPYQWAAAGYMGAIGTGQTICGALFGGAVFLGYLQGKDATRAPAIEDIERKRAIETVRELFQRFIERFGSSDCRVLTGCDWSKKKDRERYYSEKIYREKCYGYLENVLECCLQQVKSQNRSKQ